MRFQVEINLPIKKHLIKEEKMKLNDEQAFLHGADDPLIIKIDQKTKEVNERQNKLIQSLKNNDKEYYYLTRNGVLEYLLNG